MRLLVNSFKGMAPSLSDEQLGEGYSALSVNARSGRGLLEPYYASTPEATLQGSATSFAKYNNIWFSSEHTASFTNAPLKNDPWGYALIAREGDEPRITYNTIAESGVGPYPAASYPLGVPTPAAPTVIGVTTADTWHNGAGGVMPEEEPLEDEYDEADVVYSVVLVDAWKRLSAPSPATPSVAIKEWQYTNTNKVQINLPVVADPSFLATDAARGTSASIRIYRSNYSATGEGVFQFLAEVSFGTASYHDQTYSGDLQESTVSDNWNPPPNMDSSLYPNGPLEKIVVMGTDTLVGHNKRLVCFAEPDTLHAWPVEYYKVFSEDIVTIAAVGANTVVLTDGHPYVIQGSHPASMDAIRLADPVPCSNKLGVTELFDSLFFVSPLGLYSLSGFNITNISAPFATEREWKALDPDTMVLANYDGKLFVSCPTVGFTYMFDPANPTDAIRQVDFSPLAFSQLDSSGDLVYRGTDGDLYKFDDHVAASYRPLSWESKTYSFTAPHAFNVIKVRANSFPVRVIIENDKPDGTSRTITRTLNNELFGYLPHSLGTSTQWRIRVVAENTAETILIRDIQLAQSPEELD